MTPKVMEKKMANGALFMVNGKVCITVNGDEMSCRIDRATYDEAIKRKGVSTMKMKNSEYKGYVTVGPEAMSTKKDFDYWIGLALDFNKGLIGAEKRKG